MSPTERTKAEKKQYGAQKEKADEVVVVESSEEEKEDADEPLVLRKVKKVVVIAGRKPGPASRTLMSTNESVEVSTESVSEPMNVVIPFSQNPVLIKQEVLYEGANDISTDVPDAHTGDDHSFTSLGAEKEVEEGNQEPIGADQQIVEPIGVH